MAAEVAAGVVGKPFGLRGEVYVRPDPDLDVSFAPGSTFGAGPRTLTVAESRLHGNRLLVRFEGVEAREAAEELRGTVLTVARDEVRLDEGAYWASDITGRAVVTADGDPVGVVAGVADGAAHDYLVVARDDGAELLIPAVEQLVELTGDGIVVRAIPGLLDEEE